MISLEAALLDGEESVLSLKLNFLHVICQHEHYIPLNLPYPHSLFHEKNPVKSPGTVSIEGEVE